MYPATNHMNDVKFCNPKLIPFIFYTLLFGP